MGRVTLDELEAEVNEDDLDYGDDSEGDDESGILDMEESIDERAAIAEAQAVTEPKDAGVHWLQIRRVRVDGGTQSRVRLDPMIVSDYAEHFARNGTVTARTAGLTSDQLWWDDFPPLDVYLDGDYWLADGFHRLAGIDQALERAGLPLDARRNWRVQCRVFLGSRREAVLYAAGANANHGLRRTNADKRKAVEALLKDEEWRQWSDAEIARRCKVDPKTVGNIRHQLEMNREIPDSLIRKRADGATVDTTNVGASQAKSDPIAERRSKAERLHQPTPAPTPAPAKAVYVEAEPQPAPAAGDDGAYGMFAREWAMMRLTAANPQSNDFQIALFQLATPDDLREALTAQDTGGKFVAERTLAIHNRLREMVAVKPEPWTPNRVDETKRGMELLQQTRAWLREQYGDLTGRHTLLLPWERATEAVLEPLESLIEALSPQEETA